MHISAIGIGTRRLHRRDWRALLFGFSISFLTASLAKAQTAVPSQDTSLTFDVASVRQNLAPEDAQGDNNPHVNFPIGSDDAYWAERSV